MPLFSHFLSLTLLPVTALGIALELVPCGTSSSRTCTMEWCIRPGGSCTTSPGQRLRPMSTSAPQYHSDGQEALQKVQCWCNMCSAWVCKPVCEQQEISCFRKILRSEAGVRSLGSHPQCEGVTLSLQPGCSRSRVLQPSLFVYYFIHYCIPLCKQAANVLLRGRGPTSFGSLLPIQMHRIIHL